MAESTARLTPGSGIWILPHNKLVNVVAIHVKPKGLPLIIKNMRKQLNKQDLSYGVTNSTLLVHGLDPAEVDAFENTIRNGDWRKDWHPPTRIHVHPALHHYEGTGWYSKTECSTALATEGDDLIFMIDPRGVLNPHCLVEEITLSVEYCISSTKWIFALRTETSICMNMIKIAALPDKRDQMKEFQAKCKNGEFGCQGVTLFLLPVTITKNIPRTTPPSNKGLTQLHEFNRDNFSRNTPWWLDRSHSHDLVVASKCVAASGGNKDCVPESSYRALKEINMPLEETELNPVRITLGETRTTATAWQQRVRNATITTAMTDGKPKATPHDVIRRYFRRNEKSDVEVTQITQGHTRNLTYTLVPNSLACFALGPDSHIAIHTPGEEHSLHVSAPTWFAIHHPRGDVRTAAWHKIVDACHIKIEGIVGDAWRVARKPRVRIGTPQPQPHATPAMAHGWVAPATSARVPRTHVCNGPREWIVNGLLNWHRADTHGLDTTLDGSHQLPACSLSCWEQPHNTWQPNISLTGSPNTFEQWSRQNARAGRSYGTGTSF